MESQNINGAFFSKFRGRRVAVRTAPFNFNLTLFVGWYYIRYITFTMKFGGYMDNKLDLWFGLCDRDMKGVYG